MRKILKYVLCICLVLCTIFACVSCKKAPESNYLKDKKGDKVSGLSAYDIASKLYMDWQSGAIGDHERVEVLDFNATALGGVNVASRYETQEYSIKDGKIASKKWAYNTSRAGKNNGSIYQNDGTKVYLLEVDHKVVKGKKDENIAIAWPEELNEVVGEEEKLEQYNRFKKMSTTYDLSKKEYLTKDSDDAVYKYSKDESKYICTLTIDMSDEAMQNQQAKAKEEFVNALECDPDSLKMHLVDFTIVFEKVGENYRILQWQFIEDYEGKAGVTATAKQTYTATFKY